MYVLCCAELFLDFLCKHPCLASQFFFKFTGKGLASYLVGWPWHVACAELYSSVAAAAGCHLIVNLFS
jgi:hypothetical protein